MSITPRLPGKNRPGPSFRRFSTSAYIPVFLIFEVHCLILSLFGCFPYFISRNGKCKCNAYGNKGTEEGNYKSALKILITAQQNTEEIFISGQKDSLQDEI
jgi:hypothetical protein